MDDPPLVRRLDGPGQRQGQFHRLSHRQRPVAEPMGQVAPVNPLHHQDVEPIMLINPVDLHDVGMAEPRQGQDLATESLTRIRAGPLPFGEDLQGYGPVEPALLGAIDRPHAARTGLADPDEARQLGGEPVTGPRGQCRSIAVRPQTDPCGRHAPGQPIDQGPGSEPDARGRGRAGEGDRERPIREGVQPGKAGVAELQVILDRDALPLVQLTPDQFAEAIEGRAGTHDDERSLRLTSSRIMRRTLELAA